MSHQPTPPLSPQGVAEIRAEMEAPPVDSAERRQTFERAKATRFLVRQVMNSLLSPKNR